MNRAVRSAAHRFQRHFREVWESRGGGFYGFVAALTFAYLEVVDLAGDLVGVGDARVDLGWVIGFLVNNLIDAVMNLVWAAIWPLEWIQRFGIGLTSGALLVGAYGVYRLIRPTVLRLLQEPDAPPTDSAG